MGSYGLPALSIKPPEQQDPLQKYAQFQQFQNAGLQQQLEKAQLQGVNQENQLRQQQIDDTAAAMKVIGAHNGDLEGALPDLAKTVSPKTFLGLRQTAVNIKKDLADIDEKELKVRQDQNSRLLGLVNQAQQLPPDQYAASYPQIAQQAMEINPKLKLDPSQPVPQQQLGQLGIGLMTQEQFIAKEADKRAAIKAANEQALAPSQLAESQAKAQQANRVLAGTNAQGVTAEQRATLGQGAARLAEEKRHNMAVESFGGNSSVPPGVSGDEALKYLDPSVAPMVKMIGDGKADFATFTSRMNPQAKAKLAADVAAYNPNFNQANFGVSKKATEAFTSGSQGQQLTAINTAREHMKTFGELAKALDNGNIQVINRIGNSLGIQFGTNKATNFRIASQAFGGEVGKAFDGAGVVAGEREEAQKNFNDAMSKGQFSGALQTVDKLLEGKQKALQASYEASQKGQPNFGNHATQANPGERPVYVNGKLVGYTTDGKTMRAAQ